MPRRKKPKPEASPQEPEVQPDAIAGVSGWGWTRWNSRIIPLFPGSSGAAVLSSTITLPTQPTVWHHGGQSYSKDGETPLLVSPEQHNILQAFLDNDQALGTKELEKTGVSNVAVVIGKLAEKFGEHPDGPVRRPKEKGSGYFIRARSKPS